MQHIGKSAMLWPLRSISHQFLPILGTIFNPKTLKRSSGTLSEKTPNFSAHFSNSSSISGPLGRPISSQKACPSSTPTTSGANLVQKWAPGPPRTLFWLVSARFLSVFNDLTTPPMRYCCLPCFGGPLTTYKIHPLNPISLMRFDAKRCVF